MIEFTCSGCERPLKIGDEWAGKLGRCWYCQAITPVPASSAQTQNVPPLPNGMIGFICCGCGANLHIEKKWAGRMGHCPHCGTDSPVPGYPRRSSKIGILARMLAIPLAVVGFWAYFFSWVGEATPILLGGVGALAAAILFCWGGTHLYAMIFEPQAYKVWKAGGGDPWFDTLDAPFNNDPSEVRFQELYREQLRQDDQE